ncbi:hypothetical protein dsat_1835 [Alkalidesulfovibrio alkalitolerans DSM 16529]|jgi:hypothetical protein|uniref:Type II secretion system protein GspE N-terminal domain-containing protein n=1 Tax=Alkalidesulfovibrio alkalitolerans DSM 16529 TaxID=1121439 RepID=S7TG71_9BACT|nr:hypothetical protein [Alkalidesulfovibrio alkalitolerans]EPR35731.1 hypothetical protein dsat_1835 [Alkalidesulfovibrio alkalitolerans DSM 16529]
MDANFIGLHLLHKGVIDARQLTEALKRQREGNRRIGDMAVSRGLLSRAQVTEIFEAQRKRDRPFGEIALEMGMLGQKDLDDLLFSQNIHNSHLGEVLLEMGVLTADRLSPLLEEFHAEEDRRGEARRVFGEGVAAVARQVLAEALARAFLRFMHQEVKPLAAADCADDAAEDFCRRLVVTLGDGEKLIFALLLPCEAASGLDGPGRLEEDVPSGPMADGIWDIVAGYMRAALGARGVPVKECRAEECPGSLLEAAAEIPPSFCLTTPSGILVRVYCLVHDA